MKKRVAVFANGWSNDYLQEVTDGIISSAGENNADIFVFVNHSAFAESEMQNTGEINIFRLPDMEKFDGVILLANSFNLDFEINYLQEKIKKAGIPALSLEYRMDGMTSVMTDTYSGMYGLADHVMSKHGAKRIVYIGGLRDHPDSNMRLRAVLDAAAVHGITVPEENVLYGDFAKKLATIVFEEWVGKNGALPDAVLCANDVMALSICKWLEENDYKVPEDVIVTGYDCTRLGQENYPSLATVRHDWNKLGHTAMDILADKLAGRRTDTEVVLESEVVLGGSCGCEQDKNVYNRMRKVAKENKIDGLLSDSHFRHIYLAIRKAMDMEGVNRSFAGLFETEHWMEGEDFTLCLEPEFFNIVEGDGNLEIEGYSDMMYAICSLSGGKASENRLIGRDEAVFCKSDKNEEPGMYIYVPIHIEGKIYGFAMITRDINIVADNYLYIWTRHIGQYLEQVRNNITIADLTKRLTELSVTDVLTGVYNRVGCDRIMYPMLTNCNSQGIACSIMMVDVDRLKTINDIYGHASGDRAICMVASVLVEALPDGWIVVRFGGDEFLAGGVCENEKMAGDISRSIEARLEEKMRAEGIIFPLTVSIGHVMIEPGSTVNIERSLTEADKNMYKIKRKHHDILLAENVSL